MDKKIKIGSLAKELGVDIHLLVKLKSEKLLPVHYSGFGALTWLTPAGAALLRIIVESPLDLSTHLFGTVIQACRNPMWFNVKVDGVEGKKAVLIPRKLRGKILTKRIPIQAITDAAGGTTYRYDLSQR